MCSIESPREARKIGSKPHASASLRLLTNPACEAADSDGFDHVIRRRTSRILVGSCDGSGPISVSTWPAVSRTNTADRNNPPPATMSPRRAATCLGLCPAASCALPNAASATAPYPKDSFSPRASPLRSGPARSTFITTVMDQASPWLIPRRTFAATIHDQEWANSTSRGTGTAASQPRTSRRFRPTRSAR